jgi:predicted phosphatase
VHGFIVFSNHTLSLDYKQRRAVTKTTKQTSDKYLEGCLVFVKQVREITLKPNQIFVMDETSVWFDNIPNTTYTKQGKYKMFKDCHFSNFGGQTHIL